MPRLDVTTIPFEAAAAGQSGWREAFIMEYAEGTPASAVAWGQLTAAGISQISRLISLLSTPAR